MTNWADADDEKLDEAVSADYLAFYHDGRADTWACVRLFPGDIFNHMQAYQWQHWFDKLKDEAARLGVRT